MRYAPYSYALDERRRSRPDAPPLDREAALFSSMNLLLSDTEDYCALNLRPPYKENLVIVSHIQQALAVLFPTKNWFIPPPDAESMEWENQTRNI